MVRIAVINLATLHRFTLTAWPDGPHRVKTWMGVIDMNTGRCDQMRELIYLGVRNATA